MISFEHYGFTYAGATRPALTGVDMVIDAGRRVLVTGPAGAGKTTLCLSLNGLVPHFFSGKVRGRVMVKGIDTRQSTIARLAHIAGLLFQDPTDQLVSPTVEDEVAFGPENYGVPREEIARRVAESLKAVRLQGYEKRVPQTLSGGEQQACALASILAMSPEVFVLDEPTSNLDPVGTRQVSQIVSDLAREAGKTCIVVEHKLDEFLPVCDQVVVLEGGRVVLSGPPGKVFTAENVQLMHQCGVRLPQVCRLALMLRQAGIWPSHLPLPATVAEAEESLRGLLAGRLPAARPDRVVPPVGVPGPAVIEVEDLWYQYPNGTVALRGVNLAIHENDFVAIVGQNGSGKTTLVKHFNGLLRPSRGRVVVRGCDTRRETVTRLARRVGYCFQNPDHQICCRTVREELLFGPVNLGLARSDVEAVVTRVAASLHLTALLDKNPFQLSKGERQKLAVASILTMGPDILVIDEPTTGQDFRMSHEMMELARELHRQGKTVIVITHDMEIVAQYAARVVLMSEGRVLVDGAPAQVFSQRGALARASVEPPPVTQLAWRLQDLGVRPQVLTLEEMVAEIKGLLAANTGGER